MTPHATGLTAGDRHAKRVLSARDAERFRRSPESDPDPPGVASGSPLGISDNCAPKIWW